MPSKPEIVPVHKSALGKFHPIGTGKRAYLDENSRILGNAEVIHAPHNTHCVPETGLEEINGNLFEADFWLASLRVCPGHNFRFARHTPIITEVYV